MTRIATAALVLSGLAAAAAWSAPAAQTPASTQAQDAAALHAQAVALMRARQFDRAAPLMERAYQAAGATPGRALVINRAILALSLRREIVPSIEGLTAYLKDSPRDEPAIDVLGAAIDRMAPNSAGGNVPQPPALNSGVQQLVRSMNLLEQERQQERPGERKWGARWLKPAAYEAELRRDEQARIKRDQAQRTMEFAAGGVEQARASGDDVAGAEKKYRAAQADAQAAIKAMPPSPWPVTFQPIDPSAATATTAPAATRPAPAAAAPATPRR